MFWLPAALTEALVLLAAGAVRDSAAPLTIATLGTAGTLAFASLAAWGVHRSLDGHGSFFATIAGALLSSTVAAAFIAIHAHAPPDRGIFGGFGGPSTWATVPVLTIATLIATVGPTVALEWTDANTRKADFRDRPDEPGIGDNIQVQGGFGPHGGTVGVSMRF